MRTRHPYRRLIVLACAAALAGSFVEALPMLARVAALVWAVEVLAVLALVSLRRQDRQE